MQFVFHMYNVTLQIIKLRFCTLCFCKFSDNILCMQILFSSTNGKNIYGNNRQALKDEEIVFVLISYLGNSPFFSTPENEVVREYRIQNIEYQKHILFLLGLSP